MSQQSNNHREPGMPDWMSADLVEACMSKPFGTVQITGAAPGGEVWMEWKCDPKAYNGHTSYYRNPRTLQTRWDRPQAGGKATVVLSSAMTKQVIETMERQEEKAAKQERKHAVQRVQEAYNKPGVLDWGEEVGKPFVTKDIEGTQWWMVWTDTGKTKLNPVMPMAIQIFYAHKTTKATTWARSPELKEHPDVEKWLAVPWQEVIDEETRKKEQVDKKRHHRHKKERSPRSHNREKEKKRDSETHRHHSPSRRGDEKEQKRDSETHRRHSPSRRRDEKGDKRKKETVKEAHRHQSSRRRRDERQDEEEGRRHGKAHR